MLDETTYYSLLKLLQENPELTQRELAEAMGVSPGITNHCLKALVEKGRIKAANFRHYLNRKRCPYLLTPKGIDEKARITLHFLKRKQAEYAALRTEIERLRSEVLQMDIAPASTDDRTQE